METGSKTMGKEYGPEIINIEICHPHKTIVPPVQNTETSAMQRKLKVRSGIT